MAVQFDERPIMPARRSAKKTSSLTGLLMKLGIVKTEGGAQVVLVVILVLALIGIYFTIQAGNAAKPEPPTAEEIIP